MNILIVLENNFFSYDLKTFNSFIDKNEQKLKVLLI